MKEFALFYYAGRKIESPINVQDEQERFWAWLKGLGGKVVNPGTPLGYAKTVTTSGVGGPGGTANLTGFSVIMARDLDEALQIAGESPFLDIGSIEVAEAM